MIIFSMAELIEMFKDFTDEQIEEIAWQFSNSLVKQTFRSRRVTEDMLGMVREELKRRLEEKNK